MINSRSLIIVQLNQEASFDQIILNKKLIELSNNYLFYENNQKLTQCKVLQKGNSYIQFRPSLKGGVEDRIIALMPDDDHILKEIPVPIPRKKEFFQKSIKYEVEDQIFGNFDFKKILCLANARFIPHEKEDSDHFRSIIELNDF
jgi:hypothetical protein